MKTFFYFIVIGAAVYAYVHYAPAGTAERALDKVGLAHFFNESMPGYLRNKLRIPESPAVKRKKLVDDLVSTISEIKGDLQTIAASEAGSNVSPAAKLAQEKTIREKTEKAQESIAKSEETLKQLEANNAGGGVIGSVVANILEKVLPAPTPVPAVPISSGGGSKAANCPVIK